MNQYPQQQQQIVPQQQQLQQQPQHQAYPFECHFGDWREDFSRMPDFLSGQQYYPSQQQQQLPLQQQQRSWMGNEPGTMGSQWGQGQQHQQMPLENTFQQLGRHFWVHPGQQWTPFSTQQQQYPAQQQGLSGGSMGTQRGIGQGFEQMAQKIPIIGPMVEVVEQQPIIEDCVHRRVVQQIQPVIQREIIEPHTYNLVKPIYQKVVEAPVITKETRPLQEWENWGGRAMNAYSGGYPSSASSSSGYGGHPSSASSSSGYGGYPSSASSSSGYVPNIGLAQQQSFQPNIGINQQLPVHQQQTRNW